MSNVSLIDRVNVDEVQDMTDMVDYSVPDSLPVLLQTLEEENLDSSFFVDTDLTSLLTDYLEAFTDEEIMFYNSALYGNFIEFYYLVELDIYMMEVGAR